MSKKKTMSKRKHSSVVDGYFIVKNINKLKFYLYFNLFFRDLNRQTLMRKRRLTRGNS